MLVVVAVLRYYETPPVPTWFYVLAWFPTLFLLDQLVVLQGGESLLAEPRRPRDIPAFWRPRPSASRAAS